MRKFLCILLYLSVIVYSKAQNIGINNIDPEVALDITGAIRLRETYTGSPGTPVPPVVNLEGDVGNFFIYGDAYVDFEIVPSPAPDGTILIIHNRTVYAGQCSLGPYTIPKFSTSIFIWHDGLCHPASYSIPPAPSWTLDGNIGTNASEHFVGTIDNTDLIIKTSGEDRMNISKDGHIGIGTLSAENELVKIKNETLNTTLNVINQNPTSVDGYFDTHAIQGTHSGEQSGTRIAGKFVSDGGSCCLGQNIGLHTYATSSHLHGVALHAEAQGINSIAGYFKASGVSALAAHFDNGLVVVDDRIGINKIPGYNTLLDVNNTNSISAARILTDFSSSLNLKGIDIKVKNPGQGNAVGVYIDALDSPSDFAIIAEGNCKLNGIVTIGTLNPANGYKLSVDGKIIAEEVRVQISEAWPDFVFDENYSLPELKSVDNYIKKNKHLPDVPSAREVQDNGILLGDMQRILLKKIEELTIYIIDQNDRIDKLEKLIQKTSK